MPHEKKPDPTPQEMLRLADEYAAAANKLEQQRSKRQPFAEAPFRLAAIHAVELYLTAVLLAKGHDAKQVGKLRHDLCGRLKRAGDLSLRRRTISHLSALTECDEYRATRYQPQNLTSPTPLTSMKATLNDVQAKAQNALKRLGSV